MPFQTTRRVEFNQTDAAGIVHFASYFLWMESAEHEMLRSIGLSVMPPLSDASSDRHRNPHGDNGGDGNDVDPPRLTWPRVATSCDYHSAVRFEDEIDIRVTVEKIGRSSVRYRFDMSCRQTPVATGHLTAVCCDLSAGQLTKSEIPSSIRQALTPYQ